MLAEKYFKASNMDLFRVAKTVPDIFTQIETARNVQAESKWFTRADWGCDDGRERD